MPNLVAIPWAAFTPTILSIADTRAASMILGLTLAQAAWYRVRRQSQFRSRP